MYDCSPKSKFQWRQRAHFVPEVLARFHGTTATRVSFRVLFKYDKIIFEKLYGDLELSEYLSTLSNALVLDQNTKRNALLKRMCVMARKNLWRYSVVDLERVCDGNHQEPLSENEKLLCRKSMENSFAVKEMILEKSFLLTCKRLCRGPSGLEMRYEFARGLYYSAAREISARNFRLAVTFLIASGQFLGVAGTVKALILNLKCLSKVQSNSKS